MGEFTEGHLPGLEVVRVAVQVWDQAAFDEAQNGRRSSRLQVQPDPGTEAQCRIVELVVLGRDSPAGLPCERHALRKPVWHFNPDLVAVFDRLAVAPLSAECQRSRDARRHRGCGQ